MAQWLPWRKKKQTEPSTSQAAAPEASVDASESILSQDDEPALTQENSSPATLSEQLLIPTPRRSLWRRGLSRLRRVFLGPIDRMFRGRPFSEEMLAELEEALVTADVGVQTSTNLVEGLRQRCRKERPENAEALKSYLKETLRTLLEKIPSPPLVLPEGKPWVILVVGVNGVGKTTTIAKLTARFLQQRKKVLLVAGDTFRAAAIEQLEVWAKRLGVDCVRPSP